MNKLLLAYKLLFKLNKEYLTSVSKNTTFLEVFNSSDNNIVKSALYYNVKIDDLTSLLIFAHNRKIEKSCK